METVQIIEKPDYISYEEIKSVLQDAHKSNFEKGIVLHTTQLSANELKERIGKEGKCFVAMLDNKVVGTASYRVETRHSWYVNGKVVDEILVGVCSDYKGMHIYSKLYDAIEQSAINSGYKLVVFNTAEKNISKQKICLSKGFRYVNYFVADDNDHYSVVMAKWLDVCPYKKIKIWWEYHKKRCYVKIRYKPGKVKRFGI